ncbi:MtrB/PioB family outer membrane beta-barrel protein [Nitrogeniibacter mangrovi]|uniref:MtrB/PioB family outer membrane beta-barrel protein n=1 Tax=Nitrogeniibacter mangrovi TaxID=2016596 RepID=A0A6C1B156_9RHOO|nr:outer membrane protein transport protein [Nitrogeniibacter mangrovi]QID16729.1 MtrB/PioB family outer membrane beta-barrel protein [Nitrogeniibacter mangrovi]
MQTRHITRLVSAAVLAMAGTQASAAGFQLLEQNASGLGNAFAGTAAVAEDASTIFFNPAGMTELQAREFSVGVDFVRPSFDFSNTDSVFLYSPVTVPASGGMSGDAGDWSAVPNAYLSWALTDRLYAGIGFSAPFGLKTEYDDDWIGRAQALKFEIKTMNVNPSLAFKVNDMISVGLGLNWQRMEAEYARMATVLSPPFAAAGLANTKVKLDADDDSWGWNAGILFKLSPTTKLGLAYRSSVKHKLDGSLKFEGPLAGLSPLTTNSDAKADVELPDTFTLSVAQQLSSDWEMLGDLSWTGWSSIKEVKIVRTSGALAGSTAQTLETNFRDTWRISLGANYKLNDAWKLKFGVAYDQTPVKDQASRLVSLPDANRTWLTVGTQWQVNPQSRLDLGLAYLFVDKTHINNDQAADGRGRVTGTYDSDVVILGAQYSMGF